MALLQFKGIGIRALSACVPATVSKNAEALRGVVPDEEIERMRTVADVVAYIEEHM